MILSFQAVTYDMASPLGALKFCPIPPCPLCRCFCSPQLALLLQGLLLTHQYRACFSSCSEIFMI